MQHSRFLRGLVVAGSMALVATTLSATAAVPATQRRKAAMPSGLAEYLITARGVGDAGSPRKTMVLSL